MESDTDSMSKFLSQTNPYYVAIFLLEFKESNNES